MEHLDDMDCIRKVLEGDTSSYAFLVNKYQNKAYRLALGIVKIEEDAEEIAQDSFVKAYNALKNFSGNSSFSTWFYRIVYNTALSRTRKKVLPSVDIVDHQNNISLTSTEKSFKNLVNQDQIKYVKLALQQLTKEECSIVHLYYSEEMNMNDIGKVLKISHGNVRVKLTRTKKKLVAILQQLLRHELKEMVA